MLTALSLALFAHPQEPLFAERHRAWPELRSSTRTVDLADLDGDGDLDALTGKHSVLNRGDGTFSGALALDSSANFVQDSLLLDLNGDAHLDLIQVAGNAELFGFAEPNLVFVGDGQGGFTPWAGVLPPTLAQTTSVSAADVDGDGDLDLSFANLGQNELLLHVGPGVYVDSSASLPQIADDSWEALFADFDLDGDADLFFANANASCTLLLGNGAGAFADASAGLPAWTGDARSAAVGDVDADSDPDLVLAGAVFVNGGASFALSASSFPPEGVWDIALADVDLDGRLDAVAAGAGLALGDGAGQFSPQASALDGVTGLVHALALGDLDGDADCDAVVGRDLYLNGPQLEPSTDVLFLGDGQGQFVDTTMLAPLLATVEEAGIDPSLGDLDGDGDLDAFVANFKDQQFGSWEIKGSLYLNEGPGTFVDHSSELPFEHSILHTSALADADQDGDLDIFVAGYDNDDGTGGGVWWYENDGAADFNGSLARSAGGGYNVTDIALGDLDADGDNDVVGAAEWSIPPVLPSFVLDNDGSGTFTSDYGSFAAQSDASLALSLADFDGDGDLDALFGNTPSSGPFIVSSGQDRLWVNQGDGSFVEAVGALPAELIPTVELAHADVDGDGDLDVWAGRSAQDALYLNDGGGTFSAAPTQVPSEAEEPADLDLLDADLDGDLDLFLAGAQRYYENDGNGAFSDASQRLSQDVLDVRGAAFGDVDGDGDPDAFLACRGEISFWCCTSGWRGPDHLWSNRTRDLSWTRAPSLGKSFEVEWCVGAGEVNFWHIAPATGQLPLGFGTLWLDPLSAYQFDTTLSLAGGCSTRTYALPNSPALAGQTAYLQGVVALPFTTSLWLTHLEPLPFNAL